MGVNGDEVYKFVEATGGGKGEYVLEYNGQDRLLKFCQNRNSLERRNTSQSAEAYGRFEFYGFHQAKPYLLVPWNRHCRAIGRNQSVTTDLDLLLIFIESVWQVNRPRLALTLLGGHDNIDLNANVQSLLLGIMDTARATNAWLITDGLSDGVTKYIGEIYLT